MKDFDIIFLDNLKQIGELIETRNIQGAYKVSTNLIRFCDTTDDEEGVFISELLENVFSQVGPILDNYQLSEQEITELIQSLQKTYKGFIVAIEEKKRLEIFDTLVKLRFIATKFQLNQMRVGKMKSTKKSIGLPPQIEDMMSKLLTR